MSEPTPTTDTTPKPVPKHSASLNTTWSNMEDNAEEGATANGNTGLWSLLAAASKYEDLEEVDEDDDESDESSLGPHTPPPESQDYPTGPPTPVDHRSNALLATGVNASLTGQPRSESPSAKPSKEVLSLSSTLAKLAVNDFNTPAKEDISGETPPDQDQSTQAPRDGSIITKILQREFGKLARDGEEEEFLKETDCALLTEATILGTCQLTNFRLAFHASLLSTQFDEAPELQLVKAGPFVFHPPGLRRKKRRWLELSHNMLSVYLNSTDEGRARPIRSMLLSSVQKLLDYDPKKPRSLVMKMERSSGCFSTAVLEFDTEEATVDWHKEINSTLFNYRQRRNKVLYGDSPAGSSKSSSGRSSPSSDSQQESSGVRICIPLHRIESHSAEQFADLGLIVTLVINDDPLDLDASRVVPPSTPSSSSASSSSAAFTPSPLKHSSTTPSLPSAFGHPLSQTPTLTPSSTLPAIFNPTPSPFSMSYVYGTKPVNKREFRVLVFKREKEDEGKMRFPDVVMAAKARRDKHVGKPVLDGDLVTVDFGPLTFSDPVENEEISHCDPSQRRMRRKESIDKQMKRVFAIDDDVPVDVNRAWIAGRVSSAGYLLVCPTFLCFWSKSFTTRDIKLRFPMAQVNKAMPLNTKLFGHQHILGVEVRGHPLLQFGIQGHEQRDRVVNKILAAREKSVERSDSMNLPNLLERRTSVIKAGNVVIDRDSSVDASLDSLTLDTPPLVASPPPLDFVSTPTSLTPKEREPDWKSSISTAVTSIGDSNKSLFSNRVLSSPEPCPCTDEETDPNYPQPECDTNKITSLLAPISHTIDFMRTHEIPPEAFANLPKPINVPRGVLRGMKSRHFVCLTIGSRGDVQPYIALCRGLIAEGHTATIVTHDEYKDWVEGFGVGHRCAGGDPGALMKLSVEHSMFSPQFFKESLGKFRGWLDDLLRDSWLQCHDADVLIESPSAMAGVHIAEALRIPYIRAFTMPWTRTQAYPHAFLSPPVELSGSLNYSTYVVFDNVFWTAMSGQVNRWRKKMLGIKRTDIDTLAQTKIPFIYNFSSAVVPKPIDWSDLITISGYWFLDNPDLKWAPSPELLAWIKKAKEDDVPIVYIGFGSIVVPHPHAMTRSIIKGVKKAGVRAIISKGWSDRLSKETDDEPVLPPECFQLDKVPHDWLFPQIDAAMHHGGAGTTGASLRAGIPTIIKPWFGDQYFWAGRVQKLGAGLRVDSLSSSELSSALKRATSDRVMKEKASAVGEKIRNEDGVKTAIASIYMYLERARKDRTTL